MKLTLLIRTIPLIMFIVFINLFIFEFDFWSHQAEPFLNDIINWFLSGVFVVVFCFLIFLVKNIIVNYSYTGLKEQIPHTDSWEDYSFKIFILNVFIPILIGIIFSFSLIDSNQFANFLLIWINFFLILDLIWHFYFVVKN